MTIDDVFRIESYEAGGGNYQALINDALPEHVHRGSILEMLRAIVREELAPYK